MFKYIKRFSLLILLSVFVFLLGIGIYFGIQDINASKAKNFLIKEYDYGKSEIFAYKTIEYVNENEVNCSSLWFKKCTNDENLYKEIYLIDKNKNKLFVTEYKDGTFTVEKNN